MTIKPCGWEWDPQSRDFLGLFSPGNGGGCGDVSGWSWVAFRGDLRCSAFRISKESGNKFAYWKLFQNPNGGL
ncbi:hypothetical protein ACFX13_034172 [Malus domestica]